MRIFKMYKTKQNDVNLRMREKENNLKDGEIN